MMPYPRTLVPLGDIYKCNNTIARGCRERRKNPLKLEG